MRGSDEFEDHADQQDQKSPEVGQDLSDVVSAGTKDGEQGIADGAFQRASRQAAIGFHVADLGFNGAAAAEVGDYDIITATMVAVAGLSEGAALLVVSVV